MTVDVCVGDAVADQYFPSAAETGGRPQSLKGKLVEPDSQGVENNTI